MHISDMLNPENHSEKPYSPPCTNLQPQKYNTVPRSSVPPVINAASYVSSFESSYSYGSSNAYQSSSNQSYATQYTGEKQSFSGNSGTAFYSQGRKRNTELTQPKSSLRYGCDQCDYSCEHDNGPTTRLKTTQLPITLQHRHQQSPVADLNSQRLYPSQCHETDPLAALATLATSRDSRGASTQQANQWKEGERTWDNRNSIWRCNTFSDTHYEAISADSQAFSRQRSISELDQFRSVSLESSRRTVSVGSQTSRSNSPEGGRNGSYMSRSYDLGTGLTSRIVTAGSPDHRSSSSCLASPVSPAAEGLPDSPSSDIKADDEHKCSYTESCETGSPLRKVVSHFFGRNKLATRKIPKHLWVYFCRKHYQRSRYRNPRGFASLQIQLVQTQIGNLRQWGGVIDWTVKVRRREEMRSKTSTGGSTCGVPHGEFEAVADEENIEEHSERVATRRRSGAGGSIPSRYLKYVGEHKTMEEVTALVEAIQQDMEQNGGTFPDLELLPRVMGDGATNGDPDDRDKTKGRRRITKPTGVKKRRGPIIERNIIPSNTSDFLRETTTYTQGIQAYSGVPNVIYEPSLPSLRLTNPVTSAEGSQGMGSKRKLYSDPLTSPTKKPRLLSAETESEQLQHDSLQAQESQTVTPPPSAPSVSRRTSLAVDIRGASTVINHRILEDVDAALESVRVTSEVSAAFDSPM